MQITITFIIPENSTHERLDVVIAKLLPDYSRTQVQHWLKSGNFSLNGVPITTKSKIKGGEEISLNATIKAPTTWQAEAIPLNIVFEDDAMLIINKPVGLVVHPGAGNAGHTLLNALLHHAPALQALPRAGILHRLDKNTSGLLVIAKTHAALNHLSQQLKKRTLIREYQAIVYGNMISGGKIDAPIGRHPHERKRMTVTESGKPSLTHYRIAEKYRAHTRLSVRLETGRTHQIRVHLAHIHHPIVGDVTYGGRVKLAKGTQASLIETLRQFKRQALHAYMLTLTHPLTHELVSFQAPLPEDMEHLIKELKKDKEEHR